MYLVFDIGGTNMRIGGSADGKSISNSKVIPTPADFNEGIQTLKKISDELSQGQEIKAVAGGLAGPLDSQKSMLVKSPHLPGWVNQPLKTSLEDVFKTEVKLENDTAMGGLGEAVFGAGKGTKIMAYLAIGTGVGGSRIVNGKIDQNAFGFEPGHQIIVEGGNDCNCGGKGHLEAYVGGYYLEKIYGQKGELISDSNAWTQVAGHLATGLYNITVLWSPDIIILGGSVTQNISLDQLHLKLQDLTTIFSQAPIVKKGSLGQEAGLFGALALLT